MLNIIKNYFMIKIFNTIKQLLSNIKLVRLIYEKILLLRCKKCFFLKKNLICETNLNSKLNLQNFNDDYLKIAGNITTLEIPDLTGGVCSTDREIIYNLIKIIKPKKVLEIGTHIGSSTVTIALALSIINENGTLKTVDIIDVNDNLIKPWLKFKEKKSPLSNLRLLKIDKFVKFIVEDSSKFLKEDLSNYDLIFLDGSHRADHVYKEVSLALNLLNPNGIILLHDYYPASNPIPGPREAFKRINKENNQIDIYQLTNLDWAQSSKNIGSSLAILYKK
jgi:predicted O-methyltransferase YrrM